MSVIVVTALIMYSLNNSYQKGNYVIVLLFSDFHGPSQPSTEVQTGFSVIVSRLKNIVCVTTDVRQLLLFDH